MSNALAAPRPIVVIPMYKAELSAAEQISVERTIDILAGHDISFVGPRRLQAHLAELGQRYGPGVRVTLFDDGFFSSIQGYNALMRSRAFYAAFSSHSHILIAQTDTLVLRNELDAWCRQDYAYIGAPWFVGGSQPSHPLQFMGVGNGGFSLRRVADFQRVLERPRRIPNFIKSRAEDTHKRPCALRRLKHEWLLAYNFAPLFPSSNEDFFWGILVPAACSFFRVPGLADASRFAFEVEPRHLHALNGQQLPFGCHAWERYDREFWLQVLPELRGT